MSGVLGASEPPGDPSSPSDVGLGGATGPAGPAAAARSFSGAGVATIMLAGAVALGQLVTLGREIFVAGQVGASAPLDALLIALVAPLTLGGLLQNGTAAALLTAIGLIGVGEGRSTALRLAGVVITWTALIGTALAIVLALLAGPVIAVTGPGLDPDARRIAVSIVPLVAPLVVLTALATVVTTLCQIADRFRPIAAATIANPLVTTLVTVVLWPSQGVLALGIGMVAGAATTLTLVATGAARAGMLPRPALRGPGHHVRAYLRHAGPLWASSLGLTLNLVVDRAVASLLTVGSVSALRYGEAVLRTPVAALGSAWSTVASPFLVRSGADPAGGFGLTVSRLLRTVVGLAMPCAVAAVALAPSLVAVVFQRGAFDATAARATSTVVAALAPMFVLTMVEAVLIGAHNARRAGLTLLAAGLLHVSINVALDLLLIGPFGVAGIGLATSGAYLAGLSFLGVLLARREDDFAVAPILGVGARALAASLLPGIPVALLSWTAPPDAGLLPHLALLVGGGLVGLAGYLIGVRLFRIAEVEDVLRAVVQRVARRLGR